MDTDMLIIILGLSIAFLPILLIIFTSKNFNNKYTLYRRNEADTNLENLHRIQNYDFWRDFGERGEKTKTK